MPPWHPCLPLIEWCSCSKRLGKYRMDLSWIGHSVTQHSLSSCGSASKEEHICVKMSLETYKHPRNIMIAWKMYFLSNMPNFGIYVKFQGVNHAGLDCRELPSLDDVDTCWCQPAIWKTRHTKDSFHPNTQVWGFTNIWKTISDQKRLELVIRNGMEWTWCISHHEKNNFAWICFWDAWNKFHQISPKWWRKMVIYWFHGRIRQQSP